ncbi:hypothetical protein DB32_000776 [Sandaracinus amylolyticus]|uniref:EGF-like domain-containing protein n=2 Tax=Sandaracinus amylolyticus TaxID=927083 RepID=A0A0F6VZT8_9BACT|nr:hypothetical protein DB32_000776 [Sandaracinus amylolyticus]
MMRAHAYRFLVALALTSIAAGCSNDTNEPAHRGSWVEIQEVELTADALDVESLDAFESVVVEDDRLVFRFDGDSPLRVGHVVAGPSGIGYLRKLLTVEEQADGSIVATTRDATLAEYFVTFRAIAHYDPVRVDEPIEARDGVAVESLGDCMDAQPCVLGGTPSFSGNPMDLAGCTGASGFGFQPFVETDLRAMDFPIDIDVDVGITGVSASPTAYMDFDGTLRAGVHVTGDGRGQLSCMADFMAIAGGGQPPEIRLWRVIVYGIPIELLASPVLNGELTAMGDAGPFRFTAGVQVDAAMELGLKDGEYHQVGPDVSTDPFASLTTERAGPVTTTGTLTAGAALTLSIGYRWKRSGFTINVGAAFTAELTGSVGVELSMDTNGCDWTAEFPWAIEFTPSVELSLQIEDIGPTWSYEHEPFVLAEGSLGEVTGNNGRCSTAPDECTGPATCMDDVFDNVTCEGRHGFRSCGEGQGEYCLCSASGWTDCSPCRDVNAP